MSSLMANKIIGKFQEMSRKKMCWDETFKLTTNKAKNPSEKKRRKQDEMYTIRRMDLIN